MAEQPCQNNKYRRINLELGDKNGFARLAFIFCLFNSLFLVRWNRKVVLRLIVITFFAIYVQKFLYVNDMID